MPRSTELPSKRLKPSFSTRVLFCSLIPIIRKRKIGLSFLVSVRVSGCWSYVTATANLNRRFDCSVREKPIVTSVGSTRNGVDHEKELRLLTGKAKSVCEAAQAANHDSPGQAYDSVFQRFVRRIWNPVSDFDQFVPSRLCSLRAQAFDALENKRVRAAPNNPPKLPARPVMALAGARLTPGHPAAFRERYMDKEQ